MTLRGLLFSLLALTGIYVASLGGLTVFTVLRPAAALRQSVGPVVSVYELLRDRSEGVYESYRSIGSLITSGRAAPESELERLWAAIQAGGEASPAVSYAAVPMELRTPLIQAEEANRIFADELAAAMLLFWMGRGEEARGRLDDLDTLHRASLHQLGLAQEAGLAYLAGREARLASAAADAVRVVVGWVVGGLLLLPLVLLLARRRVAEPLRQLARATAQVAAGDLNVDLVPTRNDELGALAHEFNRMVLGIRTRALGRGHLATAGELLSGVAHEVKNPLMAIGAVATGRLADPDLPEPERAHWRAVDRQARRAGKLVKDLLRFVKQDPEPEPAVFGLQEQLREAVALVSYSFHADDIAFEMDLPEAPIWVLGDRHRLDQVMVNLFSNSLRTLLRVDPPRMLRLECRVEAGRAVVAVVDGGRGFPRGLEDELFHPFVGDEPGSSGLGLYISKEAMGAMGGELRYVPTGGRGSRFEVWLPLAPAPPAVAPHDAPARDPPERDAPPRAGARPVPALPPQGLTVLFVEDEDDVRRPVVRYLRLMGLEVVEARDGVEALERLRDGPEPDVVVSDLRMPRLDGLGLIDAIGERSPGLLERLLVLSGDISVFGKGPPPVPDDRIIVKPMDLDDLFERILRTAQTSGRGTVEDDGGDRPTGPT